MPTKDKLFLEEWLLDTAYAGHHVVLPSVLQIAIGELVYFCLIADIVA